MRFSREIELTMTAMVNVASDIITMSLVKTWPTPVWFHFSPSVCIPHGERREATLTLLACGFSSDGGFLPLPSLNKSPL